MKVIITEQHLDAAIAARKSPDFEICEACVVSQAIKGLPGFKEYALGYVFLNGQEKAAFCADDKTRGIERLFDAKSYDRLRALLPHEAEFREGGA